MGSEPRECHVLVQGKGGATANVGSNPLFCPIFHERRRMSCPRGSAVRTEHSPIWRAAAGAAAGGRRLTQAGELPQFSED